MNRLHRPKPVRRGARVAAIVGFASALLAFAPRLGAGQAVTLDEGRFIVSQQGKAIRVEQFSLDQAGDSLFVRAASRVSAGPPPDATAPPPPVDKSMTLVLSAFDYALRSYYSQQIAGLDTLRRGIELGGTDTAFTLYRDVNRAGSGDRLAMPPGRLFILDPPLFTVFNLIGRSLQGKTFDRRPITVLVLGLRDTLVDATVSDLGSETIRWGARPVVARKLAIADETARFTAWISPDGRLLRLARPEAGLLVERQAPPVKRRAQRPK